tara:strand:+ start:1127 stop:1363 length:237 start_codon:yes stop_codon:yes gene_type:complete
MLEKLHLQPSELDLLPYYEYEYTLEMFNDIIKERNDQETKNNREMEDKYNIGNMQSQAKKNMSQYKAPSMPKISMPKL